MFLFNNKSPVPSKNKCMIFNGLEFVTINLENLDGQIDKKKQVLIFPYKKNLIIIIIIFIFLGVAILYIFYN